MKFGVNKMVKMAVLSALAIVLMLAVRFPIFPAASFLEFEPADVVILVAAFLYGPVEGLIVTVVVALVQALTVSAASGWVGLVMHVISSGTLAIISGIIYKRFHTFKGAFAALIAGSLFRTAIMIPTNLFFTVRYWGYPREAVVALIWPALIPFNIIKSFVNSIIVILIYKPLSRLLRRYGG
jgi:riboflavin transporter FmnP